MNGNKISNRFTKNSRQNSSETNSQTEKLTKMPKNIYRYLRMKKTSNYCWSNTAGAGAATHIGNKKVIFKNYAPYTDSISEVNNTQLDNAKYTDVVMLMYNLIEYSDNYLKACESLWQYCRSQKFLDSAGTIMLVFHLSLNKTNMWNRC